jgi:glucose-6-phosphate isomerase
MDTVLKDIGDELDQTLVLVVSKSGGTKETRNGMLEAQKVFADKGLDPSKAFVAVTGKESALDKRAVEENWITRFPMWDWVGGRTSETAAVGLLPAALQGFDINQLLAGAREMDELTRGQDIKQNPAAVLAAMWHLAGGGKGTKNMVVLPYKDNMGLFAKYLQQLVMESLGKRTDLDGNEVFQGLNVFGNKGSTDQHAFIQQLRDGLKDFFATFIEVQKHRDGPSIEVDDGTTSGDYLRAFLYGTRQALTEEGRPNMTLTVREGDASDVGKLIALFERAVGLYASMVNINAYHQPGVQAGKLAGDAENAIQKEVMAALTPQPLTAAQLAEKLQKPEATEAIYHILEALAVNEGRGVTRHANQGPATTTYQRADA